MIFDPCQSRDTPPIEQIASCWKGAAVAAALPLDALARILGISIDDAEVFKTWAEDDLRRLRRNSDGPSVGMKPQRT